MPDKLVATTQALPDPIPLIGQGHYSDQVSYVLWGAGVALAGFFWVRRKFSSDNTAIAKDAAEKSLVQVLREERDKAMAEAREAWARRTQDAERIASLESENKFLKRDIEVVKQQLAYVIAAIKTIQPDFPITVHPSADPALIP